MVMLFKELIDDAFSSSRKMDELFLEEADDPRGNVYVRIGGVIESESHEKFIAESDRIISGHRLFKNA